MNRLFLKLGWQSTWRDLRAGELRLLIVAVTLAVASLTAVGFFADRLKGGLERDARQLLGGDVIINSDQPAPAEFLQKALALGLRTSQQLSFPTMARARDEDGGASKLVAFKSVSAGYPLRGNLSVAEGPGLNAELTREIPAPGTVWVEAALLDALGLEMGQPLLLGDASLRVSKIIVSEPDRGGGFISFSPRVMLNQADVAATGLIQPSSRSTYRLAVAGEDRAVKAYIAWTTQVLDKNDVRGLRIESLDSGRPEMRQTLDRAEKFLNLVSLLAALLSAVAVAIVSRGFAAKHLDDCAMLRVLGQPQRTIALAYSFEFVLVGLFASALGVALGFVVHNVFVLLLAGLVDTPRCRQTQAGVHGGAFGGCAGFCHLAAGRQQRYQTRADRRGRICRCGTAVCAGQLWGAAFAARQRQRGHGAALAGAGHAAVGGAAGFCGGASQCAGSGPAGLGAAGLAAHRPHQQLAPGHTAGCTEPFHHQRAARAKRSLSTSTAASRCEPL